MKYRVKYYDEKLSHKGRGTQVRAFDDREKAEAFAAENRIYGGPCSVEEVDDEAAPISEAKPATDSDAPLHVVQLTAENVKRLQAVTIRPDGNMVIIGGQNGAGKSSTLDAIEMALGGTKNLPSEPVRRGARKGRVVLDLGEIVVERTFSSKGTQLVVRNAAGEPQKSPQTLLDQLCSKIAFDPFAFTREEPKKQDAILKDAIGLDFTVLDAKRTEAYEARRDTNREIKKLEARLDSTPLHGNGVPSEEVSVAKLSEELEAARDVEQANDRKRDELRAARVNLDDATEAVQECSRRILELREQLKAVEALREELSEKATAQEESVALLADAVEKLEEPDMHTIRDRIASAEATNQKVRENRARREVEQQLRELEERAEGYTTTIEEVDHEKQVMLSAAKFPVEGLGFDDTGPTLHGIPLEQCSQAERLRVSVAIGAALHPRCRVMLIRDGSLLDETSMRLLAELAQQTASQVWVERVSDRDESAIIIEDGMVREVEQGAAE